MCRVVVEAYGGSSVSFDADAVKGWGSGASSTYGKSNHQVKLT